MIMILFLDTAVKTTAADETKVPLPKAEASLLRRDTVAYPTVILLVVAISTWVYCSYAFIHGHMSGCVAMLFNTIAVYLTFTVAHDAVHGSVMPKNSQYNDLLGHISGIPLLAPFHLFKIIHLTHHKYSGDHDSAPDGTSLDPDAWAGEGPILLLPLRWATVFVHYVRVFAKLYSWRSHSGTKLKADDAALNNLLCMVFLLSLSGYYCHYKVHPTAFSICVLLPQFFGATWLMYFFDYVPHRPHVIPYREDPYRSTNATSFLGSVDSHLWTWFCLGQNIHIIHHIWPSVPFYKYRGLWKKYGSTLIDSGVRVVPLIIDSHSSRVEIFPEILENKTK
jgi:beta-carotene hydroxylase